MRSLGTISSIHRFSEFAQFGLAAAVITKQYDVLEAVFDHAINHGFVHLLKQVWSKRDAARPFGVNTAGRIHRKRENRRHERVAQLSRNHRSNCMSHKSMTAENSMRAA